MQILDMILNEFVRASTGRTDNTMLNALSNSDDHMHETMVT